MLKEKKNLLKDSKWKKIRQMEVADFQNLLETVKAGAAQEGSSESAKNLAILRRYTTKQIKSISDTAVTRKESAEDEKLKSVAPEKKIELDSIETEEE